MKTSDELVNYRSLIAIAVLLASNPTPGLAPSSLPQPGTHYGWVIELWVYIKRFVSFFGFRRGADGFFSIPHLNKKRTLTFHLFWVNAPLCQGRGALLCSKIARKISHEYE